MNMVEIRNLKTGARTTIPASELAPGMMKLKIRGEEGEFFAEAKDCIAPADWKQPKPLPEGFEAIALAVAEVLPVCQFTNMTLEWWVEGFQYDAHPVSELMLWMNAAYAFNRMTHEGRDSVEIQRDVFSLCANGITSGMDAIHIVQLGRISKARAKSVLAALLNRDQEELVAFWLGRGVDLDHLIRLRVIEDQGE